MNRLRVLSVVAVSVAILSVSAPVQAQKSFDDHEMEDRFYITVGGFNRTDLRTTLRLDAKSPQAGIGLGAVILLESLFQVENQVSTVRLDGWYRFGQKHRINWTWWESERDGVSTYQEEEPIEIGEITIEQGDNVVVKDNNRLVAATWTYSFLNVEKYEAWLGIGLNFSSVDTAIQVNFNEVGEPVNKQEEAKGTVPIPTINIGGRWNFNKRIRMILNQQLFGLEFGDYSGKLSNTRILAEWNIVKNFGIGGGFERFAFEVDAEAEDFRGSLDTSYTGFILYLKGQI